MHHPRQADAGAEDEALPRAADDAWQCSRGAGPADRMVSRLRAPIPVEEAKRYGGETTVIDWHTRLVCSGCGSHRVEFVVTGTERR
jgi:hypothetical protein